MPARMFASVISSCPGYDYHGNAGLLHTILRAFATLLIASILPTCRNANLALSALQDARSFWQKLLFWRSGGGSAVSAHSRRSSSDSGRHEAAHGAALAGTEPALPAASPSEPPLLQRRPADAGVSSHALHDCPRYVPLERSRRSTCLDASDLASARGAALKRSTHSIAGMEDAACAGGSGDAGDASAQDGDGNSDVDGDGSHWYSVTTWPKKLWPWGAKIVTWPWALVSHGKGKDGDGSSDAESAHAQSASTSSGSSSLALPAAVATGDGMPWAAAQARDASGTTDTIRALIPDCHLMQCAALFGEAVPREQLQQPGGHAIGAGEGALLGPTTHRVDPAHAGAGFEPYLRKHDAALDIEYTVERRPHRHNIHAFRTTLTCRAATLAQLRRLMFDDEVCRAGTPKLIRHERLADPARVSGGGAAPKNAESTLLFQAFDSKVGVRQYPMARRVWRLPDNAGFYWVTQPYHGDAAKAKCAEQGGHVAKDFRGGFLLRCALCFLTCMLDLSCSSSRWRQVGTVPSAC